MALRPSTAGTFVIKSMFLSKTTHQGVPAEHGTRQEPADILWTVAPAWQDDWRTHH
jgi:hypothetical protein